MEQAKVGEPCLLDPTNKVWLYVRISSSSSPEAQIDARNPTVLLADELEMGQNYYVLFTTSGGL